MSEPSGQLTKRSHLFGLHEACLRGLEIAVGRFGSIPCCPDFGLRAFAFGNVAVDQYEASIRHGIAPNLNDLPIGPCSLLSKFLTRVFKATTYFCLNVFGSELATLSKQTEVFGVARTCRQISVWQIEHLLEIAVPCREAQVLVEHHHAIPHVVERDAQFGLTLPDFFEQSRVLHRDNGLRCEVL